MSAGTEQRKPGSSPAGTTDNSPVIHRWVAAKKDQSPAGTKELVMMHSFVMHSFVSCHTHVVFSTKERRRVITTDIQRQAEHHRTRTFQEELIAFLTKHGINYDETTLWD